MPIIKKSVVFKAENVNIEERTFEGYAATWDKDKIDDIIMPGAFRKSIQESFPKRKIKVLWQHFDPLGMPLDMREDEKGLFVKARVSKTKLGDEALELMKDGVVDTMSIGFIIPQGKSYRDDEGNRIITEVKLMEFSPVTFPCNDEAIITAVKSMVEGASNELKDALIKSIDTLKPIEPMDITQKEKIKPYESFEEDKNNLLKSMNELNKILKGN